MLATPFNRCACLPSDQTLCLRRNILVNKSSTMAAHSLPCSFFLFSCLCLFAAASPGQIISRACNATRFPRSCISSLSRSHLSAKAKPIDLIHASVNISIQDVRTARSMVEKDKKRHSGNTNLTFAASLCLEALNLSEYRLSLPWAENIKDARAWVSAALGYQYNCYSGFVFLNVTAQINGTMTLLASLIEHTSNALSMLWSYDLYMDKLSSWMVPKTERQGFWRVGKGGATSAFRVAKLPSKEEANVTVCKKKEGSGGVCLQTVQGAVDGAPSGLGRGCPYVIYIEEGVYNEIVRIPLEKTNLVFLGDGMGKTVITNNKSVAMSGVSTQDSATLVVVGDWFMAIDLTVKNTAGPEMHQAVALTCYSDLSLFYRCEFIGHQDTLFALSLRQFYKFCDIYGVVDFIFGNSAAVFDNCRIFVVPRQLHPEIGGSSVVTAQGRTDPAQNTGFVFHNCTVNGTNGYMRYYKGNSSYFKAYLGRPWKEFSRTVFIGCGMGELISSAGWMVWSGNFALETLFYGELWNTGAGSNRSQRVSWSSKIPAQHVHIYSADSFLQANEWIPNKLR